jgi:hypothetical protein
MSPPKKASLPAMDPSLKEEISMLRQAIRRLVQIAVNVDGLGETMQSLNTLGMATARLARLLEAEQRMGSQSSQVDIALQQALDEMHAELEIQRQAAQASRNRPLKKTGV